MLKEIGSEYWISEFPKQNYDHVIPSWLNNWNNPILTSSGRGAISLAIESISTKIKSKTALLPTYCCQSMIDPFVDHGFEIFFYNINQSDLSPNINNISKYLSKNIGIVLHLGYYGFNTNNNLTDLFSKFKKNGSYIIEDITHNLFSDYQKNSYNDFYIASIRKWMGIPSGGLFSSVENLNTSKLKGENKFYSIRKTALEIKSEYCATRNSSLKPRFLDLFQKAEEVLDNDTSAYSIDKFSSSILNQYDIEELKLKRKENYKYLLDALENMPFLEIIFKELSNDICPIFFPVYIKDHRDQIQKILIKDKIFSPIHWPIPENINLSENIESKYIYENILSIPIDQRYGKEEMNKIVNVLKNINIGES